MNPTNIVVLFCAVALCASLTLLVLYIYSVRSELSQARREASRFPLFAARGRLVCMVADGLIDEQDPAWQALYEQVNFLLRMDQRLHLLDFVLRYVRSQIRAERDPELRNRIAYILKLERETAIRVPEFGKVIGECNSALLYLVRRRTTAVHRATLLLISIVLRMLAAAMRNGASSVRLIQSAVAHPSSANVLKWQVVEAEA